MDKFQGIDNNVCRLNYMHIEIKNNEIGTWKKLRHRDMFGLGTFEHVRL